MRQLIVKVPSAQADKVLSIAKKLDGKNLIHVPAQEDATLYIHLSNSKIDPFIKGLEEVTQPEITLIPRGVITLYPPSSEAPDQVTDVAPKSSLEIFLSGIQSVGSIKGMIGYALAAGLVASIGLYSKTVYLLTASMLIAPFAGPAMNASLASAAGEWDLLRKSMKRYFLSIAICIVASALLTYLVGLSQATSLMTSTSHISSLSIILPLISGFAGALTLVQSQRDSLVSGAAVGVLVAASLAPPTALIGMAAVIGQWYMVKNAVFLILLQLAGIHLTATLVFRYYGKVDTEKVRFQKGSQKVFVTSLLISVLSLVLLVGYQFMTPVDLQRGSLNIVVENIIESQAKTVEGIELIETSANFSSSKINGQQPLVAHILLENKGPDSTNNEKKKTLMDKVLEQIREKGINTKTVFDVSFAER